jgi:tetratricopeptide (TPR) repeat protein
VTLTPDEKRRLARAITHSTEAYDLYLKGLREESYFTKNGNLNSQKLFLQAVEIDPLFAAAYAHLAQAYSLMAENRWADDTEIFEKKALQTARRAVELDSELPYAHWSLGRIYTRSYVGDLEGAISAFKRAVSLNPSYADGYVFLAYTHIYSGNVEKAAGLVEKAMRINPQYPFWYIQARGLIHFFRGEHEAAAETLSRAVARNPNVFWLRWWLIACYGQLGRVDDAAWEISEIESLGHTGTIRTFMRASSLRDPAYRNKLEAALRKAEVPEG